MTDRTEKVMTWQRALGTVKVDGDFGPTTLAASLDLLDKPVPVDAGFILDNRSMMSLAGVHHNLVAVVKLAATISTVPFVVTDGVRSVEGMWKAWGQGRTVAELKAKGCPTPEKYALPNAPKVTWLTNPLMSNHRAMADGFGHAVDIYRAPFSATDDGSGFPEIARAMNEAADRLGVKVKNLAPKDRPHWELA